MFGAVISLLYPWRCGLGVGLMLCELKDQIRPKQRRESEFSSLGQVSVRPQVCRPGRYSGLRWTEQRGQFITQELARVPE